MLDNLILAYRYEFYDWNIKKFIELYSKNKMQFNILIGFIFVGLCTISYCIYTRSNLLMFIFLLAEIILIILADRFAVKRWQQIVLGKKEHLSKVILFLKTSVTENDLYNEKQIDELIKRLTERIETRIPFNNFKSSLINFGKSIILPVITYIAGIYSSEFSKTDLNTVVTLAISIVLLLGCVFIIWDFVIQSLRKIYHRDYDAAIAFKEDLLDIKLLFFKSSIDK